MDLQLISKRALVTGSSSGIGAAIAKALAAEGAHVAVHGRNRERAEAVAREIDRAGGTSTVVIGDLTDDQAVEQLARSAAALWGGIDILVNNAGGGDAVFPHWLVTPVTVWRATFEQNVGAAVRMVAALTPSMRDSGWGRIISISSGVAAQPGPERPDYSAAKLAMVSMGTSLARAMAGTGVTVNTISPGPVLTPALERVVRAIASERGWPADADWAELERRAATEVWPMAAGRVGRTEDVASAVTFIASPRADFITGANLRVDGGFVTSVN